MAQISRPFQIALAAVGLLAVVWLLAFRGHAATSAGSGASVAPPATTAAQSSSPSAPGVAGLGRAVAKARGAVATSRQNAKALEAKSAQASSTAAPATSSTAAPVAGTAPAARPAHPTVKAHAPAAAPTTATPSRQAGLETELKAGKVVVVLVWNPLGTEDAIVHHNVLALAALHRRYAHSGHAPRHANGLHVELEQPIAVDVATPGQVASFGSLTRDVQILSTPTVLVLNRAGKVLTLTGAPGVLSLEQATDEARHLSP